jgi:hypothetical protein
MIPMTEAEVRAIVTKMIDGREQARQLAEIREWSKRLHAEAVASILRGTFR